MLNACGDGCSDKPLVILRSLKSQNQHIMDNGVLLLGYKFLFAQRNDLWARRKESEGTQGKTGNSSKRRKV